jgi:hypothetical protein
MGLLADYRKKRRERRRKRDEAQAAEIKAHRDGTGLQGSENLDRGKGGYNLGGG